MTSCSITSNAQSTGLLLVGHGTRSAVGIAQFLALAKRLAMQADPLPVGPAFLELVEPSIDTAVGRLIDRGIRRLVTMPLLLFAAGHAKADIPQAVQLALAKRGMAHIEQSQAAHLGCHPALVDLSNLRMNEALEQVSEIATCGPAETCLLLVGRGSRDESATAEMHEFARLRQLASGLKTEVAFLAMAQPLLSSQLAKTACQSYRRVIVQPHLLFYGDLVDSIAQPLSESARDHPNIHWLTTQPLADPPGAVSFAQCLEKVIWDRCGSAGIHVVPHNGDD